MTLKSRRTRLRLLLLAVSSAMVISAVGASPANATIHHYCSSCQIYNNSWVYSPYSLKLWHNYVHYIGSGSRYMGAGATGWGTTWAWNEAIRYYGGAGSFQARGGFSGSNTYATSNAHVDYNAS